MELIAMTPYIEFADEQEDAILNVHQVKKGGCLSNLLTSVLESECLRHKTVTVTPKNIQSFRSFHKVKINNLFLDVIQPDINNSLPDDFSILINENQNPIGVTNSKGGIGVKLTGLGRWMAISLLWDISLFAMCLASEINTHYIINIKNMASYDKTCMYNNSKDTTTQKTSWNIISPFTTIKFTRRFPNCSRCKITRTLKELNDTKMISVTKIIHCNVIMSNLAHPLFSKYSSILTKLTEALHGIDTLENTSRSIANVYSRSYDPVVSKYIRTDN